MTRAGGWLLPLLALLAASAGSWAQQSGYYAYSEDYGDADVQDTEGHYAYDWGGACSIGTSGKPLLAKSTPSCDLRISGVDLQADKLTGGLDGVYQLSSCFNGKVMYNRINSPAGEERVLWYSSTFGDWDISRGSVPKNEKVLLYGGEMEHASVPLAVKNWHLGSGLSSGKDDYLPINVKVECARGQIINQKTDNQAAS